MGSGWEAAGGDGQLLTARAAGPSGPRGPLPTCLVWIYFCQPVSPPFCLHSLIQVLFLLLAREGMLAESGLGRSWPSPSRQRRASGRWRAQGPAAAFEAWPRRSLACATLGETLDLPRLTFPVCEMGIM